ncbi:CHASE3 domain-containing protein [Desulfuromusa kysingii]|uniref:CHASE3 domain-containing protein n=1 Tax=Desulfuromusa kysingii TaxID=37625 RepID=A0A1H3VZB6_9BACT|nr:methyl-accepting chemotaxis protein [Desulfuromusa kysingii]SDZ80163.1 CHASE3 domain-containing protein [Desulfuromusa kysingii]
MFKNLRLKQSILLGYTIPLLLAIVAFSVVYICAQSVARNEVMVDKSYQNMIEILQLEYDISSMSRSTRGYLLQQDNNFIKLVELNEKHYRKLSQQLVGRIDDRVQKERLQKILNLVDKSVETNHQMISLVDEGNKDEAVIRFASDGGLNLSLQIDDLITEYQSHEKASLQRSKSEIKRATSLLITSIFAGVLLTVVLALAIGSWVASRISSSITEAANTASSTSAEIAATVVQHERTASQQSAMVAETASTMEELAVSSRQTTEQATSASELAGKGTMLTEDGRVAVRKAMAAMDELSTKVTAVAEQILELGEQTGQIGSIAELVKDLAVQINMLALNAAVEAVRAGEHGKGFAVVATEVRKLAAESKKSVEQVSGIVSAIQKATDTTIMRTEEGTKSIENVSTIVQTVEELFETLSETSDLINNSSQQVLLNLKQQSVAFGQVLEASNSIKDGANETAAGISQTKVGILSLNETTDKLKQML